MFAYHAADLERLLLRLLGPSPIDVEDALQQTFVAAMQAFASFRGEASVRTWLGRIAVNQAYQALRSPSVKRRASLDAVVDTLVSADVGAERDFEARRRLERFYQHLDTIAPRQRIALVLHVIEGHPMEEVAALMGAGVAATKSRVMWARRALIKRAQKDALLRELVGGDR